MKIPFLNIEIIKVKWFKSIIVLFPFVFKSGLFRSEERDFPKVEFLPDMDVLDIGTGTGVLALYACQRGVRSVTATDINPWAVWNARLNLFVGGFQKQTNVRLVPRNHSEAFSVIKPDEKFDLIMSVLPFFDAAPVTLKDLAHFDQGHQLLRSLLRDVKKFLKPNGKLIVSFWSGNGFDLVNELAEIYHLKVKILKSDDPQSGKSWIQRFPKTNVQDCFSGNEFDMVLEIQDETVENQHALNYGRWE